MGEKTILKKNPCPDCSFCQYCSKTRCSMCLPKDRCANKKRGPAGKKVHTPLFRKF